jgi:hypothetical protein
MRAILSIFVMALIAFGIHFAAFALIPAARGPTVRVSHAVLGIAGNALGDNYLTESNPEAEYPRGSLHANEVGQSILIIFWSLAHILVFSLLYFVFAKVGRSRAPRESSRAAKS